MGAIMALRVTSAHQDMGNFTTGLYVSDFSTSDPAVRAAEPTTARSRDVLAAWPVLWWELPSDDEDRVAEVVGGMQALALDAVESDLSSLPLASSPTSSATFMVEGGELKLISNARKLGLLGAASFKIEARLEWFLAGCGTLAIVIKTRSKLWTATITQDGSLPVVLIHDGNTTMPALDAVMNHSKRWERSGIGNTSLLAGMQRVADHHYRTYAAMTTLEPDLPDRLSYQGDCLGCGAPGNSREHCVPNWIAKDQGVHPVVAPIFCVDCNNYFGQTLETPVAIAARAGALPQEVGSVLFTLWAIKTALALSAASDVLIREEWMRAIRDEKMPENFQVFAETNVSMDPGYFFSVTQFSRQARQRGQFLFSFGMNGLFFVVLREESRLLDIPAISRVRPPRLRENTATSRDLPALHAHVIELMTGHRMFHTDSISKPIGKKSP